MPHVDPAKTCEKCRKAPAVFTSERLDNPLWKRTLKLCYSCAAKLFGKYDIELNKI